MKTLEIVFAAKNFARLSGSYAEREREIDFLHDPAEAILCTASFCAHELADHLRKTEPGLQCIFAEKPSGGCRCICLECESNQNSDGGFSFIVEKGKRLTIRSADRNGLINGVYEFLRIQGWCWIEPGENGEFAPAEHEIIFPEESRVFTPSFKYRAFYFEFPSQASQDFLIWMARNRMNVFGNFPLLRPLARKFGMYLLSGGHVLTKILHPDRLMESGKTLLEEHPEWFGTRKDGGKVTQENAQRTQFCCSNEELMDFIAKEIIMRLKHEWLETDILEISGFDTWGNTCMCSKCFGFSDPDKYLLFMSALRDRLNRAYERGELKHNPMLNTWAYEGTATMEAPTKIPQNMINAHDNCIAFVITRCYRHPMGDSSACPVNAGYAKIIRSWGKFSSQMTLWGGEYYNVSKHEELPLLFIDNMGKSMRFYYDNGARGITYMHTPIFDWGVRGITQNLHASLAWDVHTDIEALCKEFLFLRYGKFASAAAAAYDEIEKASLDVAEWRSWRKSILSRFLEFWISGKAEAPLALRHYRSNADAIRSGRMIARCYRKAEKILHKIFDQLWDEMPNDTHEQFIAANPEEQNRQNIMRRRLSFLECDLRSLHYAIDVITIMTLCAEAYDAVQRNDGELLERLKLKIKKQAKRMALYTEGIAFRAYTLHIGTTSALNRSQCEPFIRTLQNIILPQP